jgi:hypothetical protein
VHDSPDPSSAKQPRYYAESGHARALTNGDLGHPLPISTFRTYYQECSAAHSWYLSAWPELMREAMSRLERRWEGRS